MAFDSTKPANTTKIRNLGNVIRPNWTAIETAESSFRPYATNFANRTPLIVPNDPTAIANTYITYSKNDATGAIQLYAMNPASKITQLTSNITPSSATNGYTFLPGNILMQWGRSHANAGNTDIFFPIAFSAAPYSINITLFRASGSTTPVQFYIINDILPDTLHFVVYKSGGGQDFMWQAIGPTT